MVCFFLQIMNISLFLSDRFFFALFLFLLQNFLTNLVLLLHTGFWFQRYITSVKLDNTIVIKYLIVVRRNIIIICNKLIGICGSYYFLIVDNVLNFNLIFFRRTVWQKNKWKVGSFLFNDTSYTCMVLKSLKTDPLVCFAWSLYNQTIYSSFKKMKNVKTFEKRPLVAKLKLKTQKIVQSVIFFISFLTSGDAFQMFIHFKHLWPLGQKSYAQIFKRQSGCKIYEANLPGGMFFYWL